MSNRTIPNTDTTTPAVDSHWLLDVESRGKLGFNSGFLKNFEQAEEYARRYYRSVLERDVFLGGWWQAYLAWSLT